MDFGTGVAFSKLWSGMLVALRNKAVVPSWGVPTDFIVNRE